MADMRTDISTLFDVVKKWEDKKKEEEAASASRKRKKKREEEKQRKKEEKRRRRPKRLPQELSHRPLRQKKRKRRGKNRSSQFQVLCNRLVYEFFHFFFKFVHVL